MYQSTKYKKFVSTDKMNVSQPLFQHVGVLPYSPSINIEYSSISAGFTQSIHNLSEYWGVRRWRTALWSRIAPTHTFIAVTQKCTPVKHKFPKRLYLCPSPLDPGKFSFQNQVQRQTLNFDNIVFRTFWIKWNVLQSKDRAW